MSFSERFGPIRDLIDIIIGKFFEIVARLFGYPENPGMPVIKEKLSDQDLKEDFLKSLPLRITQWPPVSRPETWFETIFGTVPKVEPIPRYIYENQLEGFYNFYVIYYQNIVFLPDWLSEFLQVRLHFCLDLHYLEIVRQAIFVGLAGYANLIGLRIAISWFPSINPFVFPWYYLTAVTDWTEELLQGVVPVVFGVSITGSSFLILLGVLADSLNNLVLTMPFLPSEGEIVTVSRNGKSIKLIVFHYLPSLWYYYPIPDYLREYWYYHRPEILEHMQLNYKSLNIQFLPDEIFSGPKPEDFTILYRIVHFFQDWYEAYINFMFNSILPVFPNYVLPVLQKMAYNFWHNIH